MSNAFCVCDDCACVFDIADIINVSECGLDVTSVRASADGLRKFIHCLLTGNLALVNVSGTCKLYTLHETTFCGAAGRYKDHLLFLTEKKL